jgi:hypothetical protein
MRLNRAWKVWKWGPVAGAMARMLTELAQRPDLGLMHFRSHFGFTNVMVVQYWRSFEHLHRFSHDPALTHLPAWRAFNRAVASNGDVGIWHETFLVKAGQYEAVYNNMPPYGLGLAGTLVSAKGRKTSAKGRLAQTDGADAPDFEKLS